MDPAPLRFPFFKMFDVNNDTKWKGRGTLYFNDFYLKLARGGESGDEKDDAQGRRGLSCSG